MASPRPRVRRTGPCLAALLLSIAAPAGATSVIVPDQWPTIQSAIESGTDSVLVRPGTYPEKPVILRPLTVRGLVPTGTPPDELPVIGGLVLADFLGEYVHNQYIYISDLRFSDAVENTFTWAPFWNPLLMSFSRCVLDRGISDARATASGQLEYWLRSCTIEGGPLGAVYLVRPDRTWLDSCLVEHRITSETRTFFTLTNSRVTSPEPRQGPGVDILYADVDIVIRGNTFEGYEIPVQARGGGVSLVVEDNRFVGPGRYAVNFAGTDPYIVRNDVRDYEVGVHHDSTLAGGSPGGSSTFADNRFEHCRTAGIDVASEYIDCVRDTILSSGAGARLLATGMWAEQRVVAEENVILSCGGNGMTVRAGNAQIDRNVVGRCGGNGIEATTTGIYGIGSGVRGNTCYLNSGSGFVLALSGAADAIDHNLGHGNGRHGLELVADRPVTLGCDDWFANTAGALQGVEAAATDLAVDPRFCDLPEDDVHLAADSPLASPAGCGLVGALGIGCQVTAVLVDQFSAWREPDGIVVIGWRVSGALASPLRVERAAGARGPWVAVIGAPEPRGSLLTLVDREADPGRAYWYRLIEDSAGGQVLSEVSVEAMARGAFALDPVAGSPGPGPFAIRFRLPASAIVDIEVLDLQGRRTARLASGTWPAGTHALQWSGPADGGRLRPGVHLVRYRFPGGQATQRLVVIR